MRVEKAPEPSNIVLNNLKKRTGTRRAWQFVTGLLSIVTLAFVFLLLVYANSRGSLLPPAVDLELSASVRMYPARCRARCEHDPDCLLPRELVRTLQRGGLDCDAVWLLNETAVLDTYYKRRDTVWALAHPALPKSSDCNDFIINEIFTGDPEWRGVTPAPPPDVKSPYPIQATDRASSDPGDTDFAHQCAALICYARRVNSRTVMAPESPWERASGVLGTLLSVQFVCGPSVLMFAFRVASPRSHCSSQGLLAYYNNKNNLNAYCGARSVRGVCVTSMLRADHHTSLHVD